MCCLEVLLVRADRRPRSRQSIASCRRAVLPTVRAVFVFALAVYSTCRSEPLSLYSWDRCLSA